MIEYQPPCAECSVLLRAYHDAWQLDHERLRFRLIEGASSSGTSLEAFGSDWLWSTISLPEAELQAFLASRYPRAAAAARKLEAHQSQAGHAVTPRFQVAPLGVVLALSLYDPGCRDVRNRLGR